MVVNVIAARTARGLAPASAPRLLRRRMPRVSERPNRLARMRTGHWSAVLVPRAKQRASATKTSSPVTRRRIVRRRRQSQTLIARSSASAAATTRPTVAAAHRPVNGAATRRRLLTVPQAHPIWAPAVAERAALRLLAARALLQVLPPRNPK